ncbi:MAG: signal peptidase II [Thermodesulfobacteriota bacterium]
MKEIQQTRSARNKYLMLVLIAGTVVILDQITKAVILNQLPLYRSIPVIPGLFNITHIHNPGGAFGFLAEQSPWVRKTVFLFMSSAAVVLVLYFYHNTPKTHPWLSAGLALIFGGAIGNLIDRFRFGKVVDFLDFYLGSAHWPAFNVADSAITVGVTIFMIHLVFNKMPE